MPPSKKTPIDYASALAVAETAARAAGAMLLKEFHREGGPLGEGSHAEIDEPVERVIREMLVAAFPAWGFRGEETRPHVEPGADGHVWAIDPNDGTVGFLRGQRGSAVSIGLVRAGVPVLGVVYAFAAPDCDGDFISWAEGCGPLRRNGVALHARSVSQKLTASDVVLVSKAADSFPTANARAAAPARFRAMPSIAYRLALVAVGDATAATSLNSVQEWDIAGGHALLRGAGMTLLDGYGKPVSYAASGAAQIHFCFGGSEAVLRQALKGDWESILTAGGGAGDRKTGDAYDLLLTEKGRSFSTATILRRAHGCLLGQLAGDALGSLVEFEGSSAIERRYPDGPRELADGGTWNTIAGQPTDDSELALLLARSIVQDGVWSAEAAARAYSWWYRSSPFDCGSTTAQALRAISSENISGGKAAEAARAAASKSSQANGSLMRISPLAIWGWRLPPDDLARAATEDALLTHPHPVCQDATAVFCVAVAHAIRTGCAARDCYDVAIKYAQGRGADDSVCRTLAAAATNPPAEYLSQAGWVLIALQNAFFHLLNAPSFEEALVQTVRAGGDTDTNAAICGALLGAVHGRDAIPQQWRDMVLTCRPIRGIPGVAHPRPRALWPVDALAIAERLLHLGATGAHPSTGSG